MDELKACPFCGSSNTTLDYYEISCPQELGTIVVCNDCGASAKSIVDWNTRPIEDALNARIAELDILQDRYDALEKDYADVCQKRLEAADVFSRQIIELESKNAKLEAERRWIPVGERLPEERQNVLALDRTGTAYHWEYSRSLSNIFVSDYTHWMPLPSAPESEDE